MKDDLLPSVQAAPRFIQASSDVEHDPDHTTVDVPIEEFTMLLDHLKSAKVSYGTPRDSGFRSIKDGKAKEIFVDQKSVICAAPLETVVEIIGKMLTGKQAARHDTEARRDEAGIHSPASVLWELPPVNKA